jgi:hypothetical protein
MKKNVMLDDCPILPGGSKEIEPNMQGGKTSVLAQPRRLEIGLTATFFLGCLTSKFII